MIRKITLLLLLLISMNSISRAIVVRDSITISMPPFTDTSCVGTQLMFTAQGSNDTFTHVGYRWFTNSAFTGVTIDTFYTTALSEGDSVYCVLEFVNSAGVNDSDTSNVIIVHHASSIPANVLISLTTGSNPDCAGHMLTFTAYPVNGGTNPQYQWMINGVPLSGEDSISISRYFGGSDTLSCRMVSNSPCAPVDTVFSTLIPIIHIHLTAAVTIGAWRNPVCHNTVDTFTANAVDYGTDVYYQWYVDNRRIFGAVNSTYLTDSLSNGDSVFCVITTPDTCVLNPTDTSNKLYMNVLHVYNSSAYIYISHGSNPGCWDSSTTFTAVFDSIGTPYPANYEWLVNGVPTSIGSDTLTRLFSDHDIISFVVANDSGCYTHDSIIVPGEIIVRDTAPHTPLLSLISYELISDHTDLTTTWYFSDTNYYETRAGRDSVIPGATGGTYAPRILGYYYIVQYYPGENCPSQRSNIIYISLLGVNELDKANTKIYPNPSTGKVFMNWGAKKTMIHVDVYNTLGEALLHEDAVQESGHETDLSSFADGNYFIVLRDDQGNYSTNKITIMKK